MIATKTCVEVNYLQTTILLEIKKKINTLLSEDIFRLFLCSYLVQ